MRSQTLLLPIVSLLTLTTAQYTNQTAPFNLVIHSTNSTLNNTLLSACHEGAATEGLCIVPKSSEPPNPASTQYRLNYTAATTPSPVTGTVGYITFDLPGVFQEPLLFSYSPSTNVAVPLFVPEQSGTPFGILDDGTVVVPGYIDDSVSPIEYGTVKAYDRWVVCNTYVGYQYQTLAWVMGKGEAQNPSCQVVGLRRVYV